MSKKFVELKFNKERALAVDIEYKKSAKGWRPSKKFLIESLVNPDTGEVKDTYYIPKTAGEEEELQKECDLLFQHTLEVVLEVAANDKADEQETE